MRSRTAETATSIDIKTKCSWGGGSLSLTQPVGPTGTSYKGPTASWKSTIVDDPDMDLYKFKYCQHTCNKASFTIHDTVRYYDNLGALNVAIRHWFMYNPPISVPSGPWGSLLDELASLAEGRTSDSAMLPVTLLEGVKTIAMLRNPFNLLKPNFRRKVGKLTAAMCANRASGIWLEGYYGWKSFYQDTETIAKATAQFLNYDVDHTLEKLGKRLSVSAKTTQFSNTTSYVVGTTAANWLAAEQAGWLSNGYCNPNTYVRLIEHSLVHTYRLGCLQSLATSDRISKTRKFLAMMGAANWRDIRDTIWEVVPFSFVIDWFVDTRGLWAPMNRWRLGQMDIKKIGFSTQSTGTYKVQYHYPANPLYYTATPYGYKSARRDDNPVGTSDMGRYSAYYRTPGFPDESVVSGVMFSKGLSFVRCANGLALLTQLLTKPKR